MVIYIYISIYMGSNNFLLNFQVALGTQEDLSPAVGIFIAVAAHTPLAGFALGVSLVKAKAAVRTIVYVYLYM